MDKNEILEKSRKENQLHDEGVLNARNKGREWGVVGFLALCALVMLYNLIRGVDSSLPMVFFLGYLSCEALGQYGARREKIFLYSGLIGLVGTLASVASYVLETW